MAKRKKLQNQNPPRRVEIRGQDHLLAYITPEEAQMLMANGGAGQPGPMGIPAFFDVGEGAGGYGSGDADDATGGAGDPDAGIGGGGYGGGGVSGAGQAGDTSTSDAETDDPATAGAGSTEAGYSDATGQMGTPGSGLDGYQGSTGIGFGGYAGSPFGPNLAEVSYVTPELTGYNMAGLNRSQYAQLPGYMKAMMSIAPPVGYNINPLTGKIEGYKSAPIGVLGTILGGLQNALMGPPETSQDLFDRGVTTGYGPEGNVGGENYDGGDGYDDRPEVAPVNPVTGQCDEGYMFDEDMQACRLDTGGIPGVGGTGDTFAPGAYARMGLLDVAPTGLPGFSEQYGIPSQDFDAANLAFRRGTATQAGIFQDPYDLTGYTLLG